MPRPRFRVRVDDATLRHGFDAIRTELHVPDGFDAATLAEADAVAARGPLLPPEVPQSATWQDRTDLDLVAIDPAGSRDLDQALGATRRDGGYRVFYAIADLAAFVAPGSAIEAASLERGVTLYAPDQRASLHPDRINEDAASLLANETRPALLWIIDLDSAGELLDSRVERAYVCVREAMSYRQAQTEIDSGEPRPALALLKTIGKLREQLERARGAVSLALPDQEIVLDESGATHLIFDEPLPVEGWNAQISLLTGMAAAGLMIGAGKGLLRTLPPPNPDTIEELRRTAAALEVSWPETMTYAERVRSLDPTHPREVALLMRSARGLRGAGYLAFESADDLPSDYRHSAIAAPYAHVTAPLRRVCDRYANEVLLAICDDRNAPSWALARLSDLPGVMGSAGQRDAALDRAMRDYVESLVLAPLVGDTFEATIVNYGRDDSIIQLHEPAVIATLDGKLTLGNDVRVRLTAVDTRARTIDFQLVS